jgi:hypothetical protein
MWAAAFPPLSSPASGAERREGRGPVNTGPAGDALASFRMPAAAAMTQVRVKTGVMQILTRRRVLMVWTAHPNGIECQNG